MVSEITASMANDVNVVAEKHVSRSFPRKKNHGKVPKKIHKAEREKLKRDHLNDLFLELGNALEPTRQNNGKASILGDASRLLRDLLAQVQCLKRENVALLSESHYVTVEKNELRDETADLEAEIEKLQTQLQVRNPSEPAWNASPAQSQHTNSASSLPKDHLSLPVVDPSLQSPPVMGPVLVIPVHDFPAYREPETAQIPSLTPANVSRPHARYPTPSDSWSSQILAKQPKTTQELALGCNLSSSGSREEQSSGDA